MDEAQALNDKLKECTASLANVAAAVQNAERLNEKHVDRAALLEAFRAIGMMQAELVLLHTLQVERLQSTFTHLSTALTENHTLLMKLAHGHRELADDMKKARTAIGQVDEWKPLDPET